MHSKSHHLREVLVARFKRFVKHLKTDKLINCESIDFAGAIVGVTSDEQRERLGRLLELNRIQTEHALDVCSDDIGCSDDEVGDEDVDPSDREQMCVIGADEFDIESDSDSDSDSME